MPLDALAAAWRLDSHRAVGAAVCGRGDGRCACACSGRHGRARRLAPRSESARGPVAGPPPTRRWCPSGKYGCTASAAPSAVEPLHRCRTEDDALRIADAHDHGGHDRAADRKVDQAQVFGLSHSGPERDAIPLAREHAQRPARLRRCRRRARRRLRGHPSRSSQAPIQRTPLPEISGRLPSALYSDMRAPGGVGLALDDNEAVRADTLMTIADRARELRRIGAGRQVDADVSRKSFP